MQRCSSAPARTPADAPAPPASADQQRRLSGASAGPRPSAADTPGAAAAETQQQQREREREQHRELRAALVGGPAASGLLKSALDGPRRLARGFLTRAGALSLALSRHQQAAARLAVPSGAFARTFDAASTLLDAAVAVQETAEAAAGKAGGAAAAAHPPAAHKRATMTHHHHHNSGANGHVRVLTQRTRRGHGHGHALRALDSLRAEVAAGGLRALTLSRALALPVASNVFLECLVFSAFEDLLEAFDEPPTKPGKVQTAARRAAAPLLAGLCAGAVRGAVAAAAAAAAIPRSPAAAAATRRLPLRRAAGRFLSRFAAAAPATIAHDALEFGAAFGSYEACKRALLRVSLASRTARKATVVAPVPAAGDGAAGSSSAAAAQQQQAPGVTAEREGPGGEGEVYLAQEVVAAVFTAGWLSGGVQARAHPPSHTHVREGPPASHAVSFSRAKSSFFTRCCDRRRWRA